MLLLRSLDGREERELPESDEELQELVQITARDDGEDEDEEDLRLREGPHKRLCWLLLREISWDLKELEPAAAAYGH
jgi:hypothetical protein